MYGQSESVTSAIFFFCIGPSLLLSFRVTRYETLILLSATLSKFFLTRPCTASNAFATWISIIGNSLTYWATNFRVLMKHRKNFFFFLASSGSVFYAHKSKKRNNYNLVSKIFIDPFVPFFRFFQIKILVSFFVLVYIKRYFDFTPELFILSKKARTLPLF